MAARLYCALFWIQGKTVEGILLAIRLLYCALFWIQGKTRGGYDETPLDCTVPYFGFKAKLLVAQLAGHMDCTVPYFGFKAKLTCI